MGDRRRETKRGEQWRREEMRGWGWGSHIVVEGCCEEADTVPARPLRLGGLVVYRDNVQAVLCRRDALRAHVPDGREMVGSPLGWSGVGDETLGHQDEVCKLGVDRTRGLVDHAEDRTSLLGELLQALHHLLCLERVETRRRLVEKEQLGFPNQLACDAQPLPFPAADASLPAHLDTRQTNISNMFRTRVCGWATSVPLTVVSPTRVSAHLDRERRLMRFSTIVIFSSYGTCEHTTEIPTGR